MRGHDTNSRFTYKWWANTNNKGVTYNSVTNTNWAMQVQFRLMIVMFFVGGECPGAPYEMVAPSWQLPDILDWWRLTSSYRGGGAVLGE